jgi:redox-sensitive bicupin YhaK (pirin superfamily)
MHGSICPILTKGIALDYELKSPENGLYVFVLEGDVVVDGQELSTRDGLGLWDTDKVSFTAESNTSLLLMEVPMNV